MRGEKLRVKNENDFKSLMRYTQHNEMIQVADKKYLYNRIKKMVECGMKANEHLFTDEQFPKFILNFILSRYLVYRSYNKYFFKL